MQSNIKLSIKARNGVAAAVSHLPPLVFACDSDLVAQLVLHVLYLIDGERLPVPEASLVVRERHGLHHPRLHRIAVHQYLQALVASEEVAELNRGLAVPYAILMVLLFLFGGGSAVLVGYGLGWVPAAALHDVLVSVHDVAFGLVGLGLHVVDGRLLLFLRLHLVVLVVLYAHLLHFDDLPAVLSHLLGFPLHPLLFQFLLLFFLSLQ